MGIAYPTGLTVEWRSASAFGDKNDKFGGLGRNGAQKMEPGEVVAGVDQLLPVGSNYPWSAGKFHNLESSKFIVDPKGGDAHGFVTGKEVAWAIQPRRRLVRHELFRNKLGSRRAFVHQRNVSSAITRVFMVRHGSTVLSAEDRFAGVTDVELSETGREQTRRLAARLEKEQIAAVYASPLGRTIETANILSEPHGIAIQKRDGLREISHGHWEQLTRREVEERFPLEAAEWEKDPTHLLLLAARAGSP